MTSNPLHRRKRGGGDRAAREIRQYIGIPNAHLQAYIERQSDTVRMLRKNSPAHTALITEQEEILKKLIKELWARSV